MVGKVCLAVLAAVNLVGVEVDVVLESHADRRLRSVRILDSRPEEGVGRLYGALSTENGGVEAGEAEVLEQLTSNTRRVEVAGLVGSHGRYTAHVVMLPGSWNHGTTIELSRLLCQARASKNGTLYSRGDLMTNSQLGSVPGFKSGPISEGDQAPRVLPDWSGSSDVV